MPEESKLIINTDRRGFVPHVIYKISGEPGDTWGKVHEGALFSDHGMNMFCIELSNDGLLNSKRVYLSQDDAEKFLMAGLNIIQRMKEKYAE